jgi:hypothetical protein
MQSYCDKIVPQDLAVRQAAAQAISKHPGAFSINQLMDVYDWVHTNVFYQNVPIDMWPPYPPNETLRTKSGDCKNQAVLIASMVEAIGGSARVLYIPDCRHAFTEVYLGNQTDVDELNSAIWSHYNAPGGQTNWHTHTHDGITENWFIFDTAGGSYPGDTIANCMNASQFFVLMDCNRDPDDLKAPEVRWTGYGPYVGQNDTRVIQAGSGLSYSISNSILQPYSWCRNKIFVESRSARPLDWYLTDETGSQNYLRNKGFYYYYGEEQVQKATYEFDWDKKESFRVIIKNANTKSITAHLEITSTCYKD